MIQKIYNKYQNKTLAIIGSSPTATLYKSKEDISMAINGAIKLNERIDYFITSHPTAFLKSWFYLKPNIPRIINSVSALHYTKMFTNKKELKCSINKYKKSLFKQNQIDEDIGFRFNVLFRDLPKPIEPNMYFYFGRLNIDPLKVISRRQTRIYSGGTGACAALQLGFIMGFKEIHLYGCSFNNQKEKHLAGQNYFYNAKNGEAGRTTNDQKNFIERTILKIKRSGVKIYSHGKTKLKYTIKL